MQNKALVVLVAAVAIVFSNVSAQTSAFTYQGRLDENGTAANGIYDLQFSLYDSITNGSVVAGPVTNTAASVSQGLFTVSLDFGAGALNGAQRWIEIGVRTNGSTGSFTLLTPRQSVASTPYALRSISAATSDTATNAITAATATTASSVAGTNITGIIKTAQLPSSVVLNDGSAVTLTGSLTLPANGLIVGSSTNQLVAKYNRVGIGQVPLDDSTNSFIIGNSVAITPTLEVGNSVAIPSSSYYAYRGAKTLYYNVSPADFVSANSGVYQGRIDEGFSSSNIDGLNSMWASGGTAGNAAYFVAPVHLPQSAVITSLRASVIKNGGSLQSTVELYRSSGTGYSVNSAQLVASVATISSGGLIQTLTASSINASYNVVDNAIYAYFLRFSGEQNTQSLRFLSARITYTVQNVE